jgi:hypothetical protein
MNIHALKGIRTHDPSNQAAVCLPVRPHGHRDRFVVWLLVENYEKASVLTSSTEGSYTYLGNHVSLPLAARHTHARTNTHVRAVNLEM